MVVSMECPSTSCQKALRAGTRYSRSRKRSQTAEGSYTWLWTSTIIVRSSVRSQGPHQQAGVELRQLEAGDAVGSRVGFDGRPLLELLAAREPVRPLQRFRLRVDQQPSLQAVHAARVAAEELRL